MGSFRKDGYHPLIARMISIVVSSENHGTCLMGCVDLMVSSFDGYPKSLSFKFCSKIDTIGFTEVEPMEQ